MRKINDPFKFSIVIPWKNKPSRELLLKNLLDCLSVQDLKCPEITIEFELIIAEQIESDKILQAIKSIEDIVPKNLATYRHIQLKSNECFNKSWCMNIGAKNAKYDDLIFMDADSLFDSNFLKSVRLYMLESLADKYRKIFFCWNQLIGLQGKDNPNIRYIRPDLTRAMGGIWFSEKNENYFGYGGEDNDMWERASYLLGFQPHCMNYTLLHQYHDWEIPAPNAVRYFEKARSNPVKVTDRIKAAGIGKEFQPTLIGMDDLS